MASKISEGVEISVETFYQPDYSNPVSGEYMFAYRITIENHNNFSVKLHRRHWHIFDSNGSYREVEGKASSVSSPFSSPGNGINTSAAATSAPKWARCTALTPWRTSTTKRPSK